MKTKTPKTVRRGDSKAPPKSKVKRAPEERVIDLVPARLKLKRILVPMDFSAESKKALRYAVPFAEQFGAKLILLYIVEPYPMPDFSAFPLVMEDDKVIASCKAKLDQIIKQQAIDPKLIDRTLVREGQPFHEITEAAEALKADLIVISTHGHTGMKHVLLGSTTERVVQHAPCPVLVVRDKEHEFV